MRYRLGRITVRTIFALFGVLLLLGPFFVNDVMLGHNQRPYEEGRVPQTSLAATPIPTTTPMASDVDSMLQEREIRAGPVVVDLAHGNRLNRGRFEPLAAALARRGIGLNFWLSDVDVMSVSNYLDYPDQSNELASLLDNASALVVVSPFFLWSDQEIALVERFVADGGHLLLISDPDVVGDLAQDINNLGEPFGVVFNDDYLYDTVNNDGNHTFIYPNNFADQGERLEERRIAFYGARSISGEITPQLRTAETTLSSVRTGVTNFATVALAGLKVNNTAGRVLAMSDFDVLTTPFVERHDNNDLLELVAGFLSSAERRATLSDFPAYLGKEVALIFGNASAVDAQILMEGARLQQSLELSGRNLNLAGSTLLTETLAAGATAPEFDLIALADYALMDEETSLLKQIGFTRVEVIPEPEETPEPAATPVPEPVTPTATITAPAGITVPATVTGTAPMTATLPAADAGAEAVGASETGTGEATAMSTPEPPPTVYLEKADGLRLLARETVIIAQLQLPGQHRLVAVLGNDNAGIRSGVDRLLNGDYSGCLTGSDLIVCSFEGSPAPTSEPTPEPTPTETGEPEAADEAVPSMPTMTPMPEDEPPAGSILLIDDNDSAGSSETSEADIYLQALTQMGYRPTLWDIAEEGIPTAEDLLQHQWVIWSAGGYENGGPSLGDLDAVLGYINAGGWLTISSRRPFFGMSAEDPSVIADIVVEDEAPELVAGLPSEVIDLPNGLLPVVPLETNGEGEEDAPLVALRRGPDSGSAGAPLLFLARDEDAPESTGAKLMVLGMSLGWLPDEYEQPLVRNMVNVMLEEDGVLLQDAP